MRDASLPKTTSNQSTPGKPRGTSLAERQADMRKRAAKMLELVKANREKARESLRIRLAD